MVETPEQGIMGVEHNTFNKDGYICLQENTYRICAPNLPDTDKMTACIFWTKTSPTDTLPTWEKVVSRSLLLSASRNNKKHSLERLSTILNALIRNLIRTMSKSLVI
jgi:hypothetical protein